MHNNNDFSQDGLTFHSAITSVDGGYIEVGNIVIFSFRISYSTLTKNSYLINGMPVPKMDNLADNQTAYVPSCNKGAVITLLKGGKFYYTGESATTSGTIIVSGCYIKD